MDERTEIERLIRLERYLRDTSQWARWRQCYHFDSSKTNIDISWFKGQIDEWVEKSQKVAAAGVSTLHTVVPNDVRVSGDRGLAISSCQITSRFEYEGMEFDLVALLRLVSCMERVGGEWKMVSLEGVYLQDHIRGVTPCQTKTKEKEEEVEEVVVVDFDMSNMADLRSSYRCLIWNIERKGMKARRDLPGIDRPESVKEVMDRADSWIGLER